jgi:hypothetical protein
MRTVVPAVFLLALLEGCNWIDPGVCTQIGCLDGLEVVLADPPSQDFSISAVVNGETVQTIECPGGTCPQLFFEGLVSEKVTIVVETADDVFEQTFSPAYERVQPNGRGCPPVCYSAEVTMNTPG